MDRRDLRTAGPRTERELVASQWRLIRTRFLRHKMAVFSLVLLGIFYFGVLFAEFVAPYDPRHRHLEYQYSPPQRIRLIDTDGGLTMRPFVYGLSSELNLATFRNIYRVDRQARYRLSLFVRGDPYELWGLFPSDVHLFGVKEGQAFLFGTDRLGRDMLSRVIHGGRISLSIGLVGVAISFVLGIILGGISGYYGGRLDSFIQRVVEFLRSIPTLPLWMALSVALPPFWTITQVYFGIVVILSLVGWTDVARVVRGKFMAVREEEFIIAAAVSGASIPRILFRHLMPSFGSYLIASLTLSIPGMILGETALSFIGLGLQPPAISWGVLLKEAQRIHVLSGSPWILIPGAFVAVAILAFNFVGDGLRDAADPYASR